MRNLIRLLVLTVIATPVVAETPMTADAFDLYTRGKTVFYSSQGQRYGAEKYFDRRRVRWSDFGDQCQEGHWYADGSEICFVYEANPSVPQCWHFFLDDGGLTAKFTGEGPQTTLQEVQNSADEMLCFGPEIGV
ncbi:hypothetical protein NBRC116601_15750 [Cognatishimia sp. WU-CL00825]|uniref:hypothetical protein n=1 Tax=Cognatishimia sp. WU-CL00825 TaxID=3127658 RepID=UPI00310534DA